MMRAQHLTLSKVGPHGVKYPLHRSVTLATSIHLVEDESAKG